MKDGPSEKAKPATLLVVDGDVLIRLVVAGYLRDCGYRVLEAAQGAEALTVLSEADHGVAAVLADVDLPGDTDGFALSQWIREHQPQVKVILARTPERVAKAAANLCDEGPMLARPYDPQLVIDRIKRALAGGV